MIVQTRPILAALLDYYVVDLPVDSTFQLSSLLPKFILVPASIQNAPVCDPANGPLNAREKKRGPACLILQSIAMTFPVVASLTDTDAGVWK